MNSSCIILSKYVFRLPEYVRHININFCGACVVECAFSRDLNRIRCAYRNVYAMYGMSYFDLKSNINMSK